LRLNFQASLERIAKLDTVTALTKQSDMLAKLKTALATLDAERVYLNREAFLKDVKKTIAAQSLSLSAAQLKAVWQLLGEADESADICRAAKGNPEPDANLQDTENVPLKEDIEAYFAREVLPHVPDAWIDYDKTKVGYEIPFNRHFYTYTPPRPLEAINADLKQVSREIMELLAEVTA
jgi:type I restriction enzyme M protein